MYTASGRIDQDELIREYLPVVRGEALALKTKLPDGIDLDDLIQAGTIGLLDALPRYDSSSGVSFGAFAKQRIRGAMIDELRTSDWLPRSVRRSARAMEDSIRSLEQRLGRPPAEKEIAADLGITLTEYQRLLGDTNNGFLLPFEEMVSEVGEPPAVEDTRSQPFDALFDHERKQAVVDAIDALPHREKQVMALLYQEDRNLKEIGAIFGVTESRVCQLHSQAIKRIRSHVREAHPDV